MVSVGSGLNRFRQSYKDRREAEAAELAALSRLKASGSPLEASQRRDHKQAEVTLLGDLYKLVWKLRWQHDRSPETHDYHTRALFRAIDPNTPVTEIDLEMVEEAVIEWEEDEISGSTINKRMTHLRLMLKEAYERGWVEKVIKLPRRKEFKGRIRWLSDAEEAKVLSKCEELGFHDLSDFIVVAIDTGFRRGELLNFETADFFNGRLHLHHGETKNGEARSVPATDRVRLILQRRSNSRKPFECFNVYTLRYTWKKLQAALGYEKDKQFLVHMLRHTCASRLVQDGVSLPIVKEWMGHSDIKTTMRYAHLAPDALNEALAVLNRRNGLPELKVVSQ